MNKKISIVIPVYNAQDNISQCLESIYLEKKVAYEVIIINDCSTDGTLEKLKDFSCKVVKLDKHYGASVARNEGAKKSCGDIILFLDADVLLQKDGLKQLRDSFEKYPMADVVQGIYTQEPTTNNLAALARNYYKYHKTQRISQEYIFGINSYCFAIKREVFENLDGFDSQAEGVEDVEFAMQLKKKGYKILLNKNLQVKHSKYYTFIGLLKADYRKVLAKTKLLLNTHFKPQITQRNTDYTQNLTDITFSLNRKNEMAPEFLSVFLSSLILVSVVCLGVSMNLFFLYSSVGLILLFIFLNISFLNLIKKNRGLFFSIKCLFVYYFEMLIAQFAIFKATYDWIIIGRKY